MPKKVIMKILNKLRPGDLFMNIVTMEISKDSVHFPEELELIPHLCCDEGKYQNRYIVEARISSLHPFFEKHCKNYHVRTNILNSLISSYKVDILCRTRLEIEATFNFDFDWKKYKEQNLTESLDRQTEIAEALYNFIHLVDVRKAREGRKVPSEVPEKKPYTNWAMENQ